MKRIFRDNGLSIVLFTAFFLSVIGHFFTGFAVFNDEHRDHGQASVGVAEYALEGHFYQSLFENWESEFLQMGLYVLLTAYLFQKGSADSKRPGVTERVDVIAEDSRDDPSMPWPVRRGGLALAIYKYSLSIALFGLFVFSFAFHALGGVAAYNAEQIQHGNETVSVMSYLATSEFWFQSFQNWQSEFLSVGTMIVLAIFLRQIGSPESKPVDTPHSSTGS